MCICDAKSENNARTQNSPPDSFENRPAAHATNFISHYPKIQSLLQTALATISNVNETKCIEVRILLDSGSQKSYISRNIARPFNLKVFETENVLLRTAFGDTDPKPKALSRVKFCLRNNSGKLNMYVDSYSVPKTYHSINRQSFDLSEYLHLQGLRLANNYIGDLNINILLGAYFYWQIITSDIRRGDKYGPVAVDTKLGYVLSAPVNVSNSNFLTTNAIISITNLTANVFQIKQVSASELEASNLSRFFDLESSGIKLENEKSVHEYFLNNLKYDGERYEVALPFKPPTTR